jgi:hypothetical protein
MIFVKRKIANRKCGIYTVKYQTTIVWVLFIPVFKTEKILGHNM